MVTRATRDVLDFSVRTITNARIDGSTGSVLIDGATIGSTAPAAGTFTNLTATTSATFTGANVVMDQLTFNPINGANASVSMIGSDAFKVAAGTTAQRPTTPVDGMIRYNTTNGEFEGYVGGSWVTIQAGGSGFLPLTGGTITNGTNGSITLSDVAGIIDIQGASGYLFAQQIQVGAGTGVANGLIFGTAAGTLLNSGLLSTATGDALVLRVLGNNMVIIRDLAEAATANVVINGTSAIKIPIGNTLQRPSAPGNGMMRYNTDTATIEAYVGGTWANVAFGDYLPITGGTITNGTNGSVAVVDASGYLYGTHVQASTGNNISSGFQFASAAGTTLDTGITSNLAGDIVRVRLLGATSLTIRANTNTADAVVAANGRTAFRVPGGTTLERPTAPVIGMIRFNTDTIGYECYAGGAWRNLALGEFLPLTGGTITNGTNGSVSIIDASGYLYATHVEASTGDNNSSGFQFASAAGTVIGAGMTASLAGDIVRIKINGTASLTVRDIANTADPVLVVNGITAMRLPVGSTAQQPTAPLNGMIRYNNTDHRVEAYAAGAWRTVDNRFATNLVAGDVESATTAEINTAAGLGGSGAPLFIRPDRLFGTVNEAAGTIADPNGSILYKNPTAGTMSWLRIVDIVGPVGPVGPNGTIVKSTRDVVLSDSWTPVLPLTYVVPPGMTLIRFFVSGLYATGGGSSVTHDLSGYWNITEGDVLQIENFRLLINGTIVANMTSVGGTSTGNVTGVYLTDVAMTWPTPPGPNTTYSVSFLG